MIVQIGFFNDDIRKISKSFSIQREIECNLKEDTSIINPVLRLSAVNMETISKCNYCYIPQFKRYYFINSIELSIGAIVEIECSVDVLNTYKNEILNSDCVIARNENLYNVYLDDEKFKTYNYNRVQTKTFSNGFSDTVNMVLCVSGG